MQQHQRYHEKSAAQAAKMRTLEEYLQEIEVIHWHPLSLLAIGCVRKQTSFGAGRTFPRWDVPAPGRWGIVGQGRKALRAYSYICSGTMLRRMVFFSTPDIDSVTLVLGWRCAQANGKRMLCWVDSARSGTICNRNFTKLILVWF